MNFINNSQIIKITQRQNNQIIPYYVRSKIFRLFQILITKIIVIIKMGQSSINVNTQNTETQVSNKPQQQFVRIKKNNNNSHITGVIKFSQQFSCETPIIVKVKNGQKLYAEQDYNAPNFLTIVNKRASKAKKYLIERDIIKIIAKMSQILASMQAKAVVYEGFNSSCSQGLKNILYCVNSQHKNQAIKLIPNEIIRKNQQTSYQPIKHKHRQLHQAHSYQQVMKNGAKILSCICLLKTELHFNDYQLIMKQIEKLYSSDIVNIFRAMFSYGWDCIGFNQWIQKTIKNDTKDSKIKAPSQIPFKNQNRSPFKQTDKNKKYMPKGPLIISNASKTSNKSSSIATPIKQVKLDIETSAKKRSNQVYYHVQDTVKQTDPISAFCLVSNGKNIEKRKEQIAISERINRTKSTSQISNNSKSMQKNFSKYNYLNKNQRNIEHIPNQDLACNYSPTFLKSPYLDRTQRQKSARQKYTKYQNPDLIQRFKKEITSMYDMIDQEYQNPFIKTVKQVSARFQESGKLSSTSPRQVSQQGYFKHQMDVPSKKATESKDRGDIFKSSLDKLTKQVDKSKKLIANITDERPQKNLIALAYKQNTEMLKCIKNEIVITEDNKYHDIQLSDNDEIDLENQNI